MGRKKVTSKSTRIRRRNWTFTTTGTKPEWNQELITYMGNLVTVTDSPNHCGLYCKMREVTDPAGVPTVEGYIELKRAMSARSIKRGTAFGKAMKMTPRHGTGKQMLTALAHWNEVHEFGTPKKNPGRPRKG